MDWIEQLFGLDLDGGNGTAELVIVLAVLCCLSAVFFALLKRKETR